LTFFSVISDIGGYLGLFLGCSLLSIIEIFFFLGAKIYEITTRIFCKDKKVVDIPTKSENVTLKLEKICERLEKLENDFKNLKENQHKYDEFFKVELIKTKDETIKNSSKELFLEEVG
jgi:hypothetical protein